LSDVLGFIVKLFAVNKLVGLHVKGCYMVKSQVG